jgi:uncharacterized protein YecE (DUF72 family)
MKSAKREPSKRAILNQENMKPIYIGTSGWSYKGWDKTFYPKDVAKSRQLEFYATQFLSVEINATFYRLPTPNMVRGWRDRAPAGFIYAIKGSRFITHMKKLANLDGALDRFFAAISPLQSRTGVVLWQLPRLVRKDAARLEEFLQQLPVTYRYALEFRHESWLDEETFALLRKYAVGHVSLSSMGMPMDLTVTADLIYIRFHGLAGGAAHNYTRAELEPWAEHIRRQSRLGHTIYAYFNNDWNVRAPGNAKTLMQMVGAPAMLAHAA